MIQADHTLANGLGDGGAEEKSREEIESRRPCHGKFGRQHPRRDDGGNAVGRIVEAVQKIEDQGDQDGDQDQDQVFIHVKSFKFRVSGFESRSSDLTLLRT